ncbi:MAG: hypothetical protein ACPGUV_04235 [Polyangiales bacterium]
MRATTRTLYDLMPLARAYLRELEEVASFHRLQEMPLLCVALILAAIEKNRPAEQGHRFGRH